MSIGHWRGHRTWGRSSGFGVEKKLHDFPVSEPFAFHTEVYFSCKSIYGFVFLSRERVRGEIQREEKRPVCESEGNTLWCLTEPGTYLSNATDSSPVNTTFSGSRTGGWLLRIHSLPVGPQLFSRVTKMGRLLLLLGKHCRRRAVGGDKNSLTNGLQKSRDIFGTSFWSRLNKQNSRYLSFDFPMG